MPLPLLLTHRRDAAPPEHPMEYRKLGQSGLEVSAVSIGGWITFGGTIQDKAARAVVRKAIDGGVNFIDLADVYARGEAERVVGRMLSDFRRESLVISSKCFWPMSEDPNDRGLSRKHIFQSVERSLANLGTDYLDLYFCHREDTRTPLEETVRAMDDLVHQGKVLYWGTSVWPAGTLRRAHEIAERKNLYAPRVEQPEYNLLDRSIEAEVLPAARELGMGVVVWSPLAGGILTGKYNDGIPKGSRGEKTKWLEGELTEANLGRVRRFCELARRLDMRPEQLALAWILTRPEISCVITGATSAEQVEHNLAAAGKKIPPEAFSEIEALFPSS